MIENEHRIFKYPFTSDVAQKFCLDNCSLGGYLNNYLDNLKTKTAIIEDYIDKDFLIDYQHFYCRSFQSYERFTKRIHFFSNSFTEEDFRNYLIDDRDDSIKELKESYLGFIIIKPIKDHNDKWIIGRTLLKFYPEELRGGIIKEKHEVSLFGITLFVDSLQFQTQDQGVSACATIALWIALNHLSHRFNIRYHSPSEITEISASFPSQYRIFPSSGLTWQQMINYIRSIGFDIEVIKVGEADNDKIFTDAVKAYIQNNIPLIGGLSLKRDKELPQYHAVVIVGYRCEDGGKIVELYVHDDQIGPYSITTPIGSFINWNNTWSKERGYSVKIDKLMIPIYHKIRLTYARIHGQYLNYLNELKQEDPKFRATLHLTTVQRLKKFLLKKQFNDKDNILLEFLPRFLWIIRDYYDNELICDYVFDATSIFSKDTILNIFYT